MDKYEKALEIARRKRNDHFTDWTDEDIEEIFPELKVSEDEKTRLWIISYLDNRSLNSGIIQEQMSIKKAIEWLEKHKDCDRLIQESYDRGFTMGEDIERKRWTSKDKLSEVEDDTSEESLPMFKEGDWIASEKAHEDYRTMLIKSVVGDKYYFVTNLGYEGFMTLKSMNECDYHLWALKDARKGDILFDYDTYTIGIFKGIKDGYNYKVWESVCYCDSNGHDLYGTGLGGQHRIDYVLPTTSEERNRLLAVIDREGYEVDWTELKLRKKGDGTFCKKMADLTKGWKPTEEQIKCLELACKGLPFDSWKMEEIYNEVKKLTDG